jgi:aerobic-type carbon monoxide dehydrogenase small subunit (CoxS/CutS family)
MADSDRVEFTCNGVAVAVDAAPQESLLSVLRERLWLRSVKDGCAPQGQCGCCTVLVDGDARVACVTPAVRVAGRSVTTLEGLDPTRRDALAATFVATGGSQCGFCTPGIVVRAAALLDRGRSGTADVERALGAHLCRCTGWRTVVEAVTAAAAGGTATRPDGPAAQRAGLEGGTRQRVGPDVPLGSAGFADDTAPPDAVVAVPLHPASNTEGVEAAGLRWVVADSLREARSRAGAVPGRRTTLDEAPPLPLPACPPGGVRLATSWVEPAYLEPDASWCEPGGSPASPLANGGAFGGKLHSAAPAAARALADQLGRTVRVVYSREDVVRLGPKRPPIAASAVVRDGAVLIEGRVLGSTTGWEASPPAVTLPVHERWDEAPGLGPPTSSALRAFPLAERTVLREAAMTEAGLDHSSSAAGDRVAGARLAAVAVAPGGAVAGARVDLDPATGTLAGVALRVGAGDPLDGVVLRSYCIGAAHMALGWVLTEGIAVDPDTGAVLDLTIRSFGILRARATPPIRVEILDESGAPRPSASDAVFAAVAAAAWAAVTVFDGARPETFPTRATRSSRAARA